MEPASGTWESKLSSPLSAPAPNSLFLYYTRNTHLHLCVSPQEKANSFSSQLPFESHQWVWLRHPASLTGTSMGLRAGQPTGPILTPGLGPKEGDAVACLGVSLLSFTASPVNVTNSAMEKIKQQTTKCC